MVLTDPLDKTLDAVLAIALDAALAMNESGVIVGWNPVAQRTFGWSAKEAIGRRVDDLIVPPEVRQLHANGLERYLRTGVATMLGRHVEVIAIDRNGQRFSAELSTTEATFAGTRIFVGFIRDISTRKETENQLAEVNDRLSLAVKAHCIGIFDTDVRAGTVLWNEELEEIFGYSPKTFNSSIKTWREHVIPADLASYEKVLRLAIAEGLHEVSYNYRMRRCDGETRYVEASARLFYDDAGQNYRRVGVNIDVTQRKEMERHLSQTRSELAHLSRLNSLGAMASSLSHELNQPLTAIVNYVGAARVLAGDPAIEWRDLIIDPLERAGASAMRAGDIVRRLREMSLKRPIHKREFTITEILQETVPMVRENDARLQVHVDLEINPQADQVFTDPTLIQQVLFNLMRNAAEVLSKTGGRITVRAKRYKTNNVVIEVADNGPGLPPDIKANLFAAFRTTKSDGMGVGLSVCRTIIESQGGKIWAESDSGGTTFFFTVRRGKTIVAAVS